MPKQHQPYPSLPKSVFASCFLVASLLSMVPPASAQAWVPPAGVGAVTTQFQWISNTGHFLSNGFLRSASGSQNASIYMETEYAFTDRLSTSFGVAYVFSRYSSKDVPPPIFPFLPSDQCRCWNHEWQDFGFTARYNVLGGGRRSYALTPSITVGVPSHDYAFRGEAVVGKNLKEVALAVDAGKRLDMISRKLSVQGRYSYTIVEKVLDISSNRSNFSLEPGFEVTRKLFARALFSWQQVHGGLRIGAPGTALLPPGDINTPERLVQSDRLRRANYFHVGTGVSYSLPRVDLFASYIAYASGTDTHAGRAFTVGMSWPFEWHPGGKRH
jgi:hypothetical protein